MRIPRRLSERRLIGELFENRREAYLYHVVTTNSLEEEKDIGEVFEWYNQMGQSENPWVQDGAGALWAEPRKCSIFMDRSNCLQFVYWIQVAFLSGILVQACYCDLSVEDGAGSGGLSGVEGK